MAGLTDEMLFYGGLAVAGSSLILAILFFFILQAKQIRLNVRLEEEYGKKEKNRRREYM